MKEAYNVASIIVGVDFSTHSKSAVLQARHLAKKWNASLTLVHGFEDPIVSEVRFKEIIDDMTQYYKKRILKIYKPKPNEAVIVRCGRPYEILIDAATRVKNPLLIVGASSVTGVVKKFILGSTAERVAQKSQFPVWIHRGSKIVAMNRALVPIDFSERISYALGFLKKNGLGKIKSEIFHVIKYSSPGLDLHAWREINEEIARENLRQLTEFKKSHPKLTVIETSGEVAEEIEKQAKKFDFIAITPRVPTSFFSGFGKVTSKVVRNSKKSILIIP